MDTAKNIVERLAQLTARVREPKDVNDLNIVQHQLETLQKEHLATQKVNRKVMTENMDLTSRVKVLEQQLARIKVEGREIVAEPDQQIEHLGALFTRKAGGRYLRKPFCPKCRRALKDVSPALPYTCSTCKTFSSFKASEINDIILYLEKG